MLVVLEYGGGGSPRAIRASYSPAELLVTARRIQRRRTLDAAEQMENGYLVASAARAGKKGHSGLRRVLAQMREAAGMRRKPMDASRLIEGLGLGRRGRRG